MAVRSLTSRGHCFIRAVQNRPLTIWTSSNPSLINVNKLLGESSSNLSSLCVQGKTVQCSQIGALLSKSGAQHQLLWTRNYSVYNKDKETPHYYDVLCLPTDATRQEIRERFYKYVRLYYPNYEVKEAFDVLRCLKLRRMYDLKFNVRGNPDAKFSEEQKNIEEYWRKMKPFSGMPCDTWEKYVCDGLESAYVVACSTVLLPLLVLFTLILLTGYEIHIPGFPCLKAWFRDNFGWAYPQEEFAKS